MPLTTDAVFFAVKRSSEIPDPRLRRFGGNRGIPRGDLREVAADSKPFATYFQR